MQPVVLLIERAVLFLRQKSSMNTIEYRVQVSRVLVFNPKLWFSIWKLRWRLTFICEGLADQSEPKSKVLLIHMLTGHI